MLNKQQAKIARIRRQIDAKAMTLHRHSAFFWDLTAQGFTK
jgi:hypothetical protein